MTRPASASRHPGLLRELGVAQLLAPLFGISEANFERQRIGSTLTVPVFVGRGPDDSGPPIRTDLHCEPIGNAMLMLEGRKKWTLVSPGHSRLVRPTISPDGRAYFLSALPAEPPFPLGAFAGHAEPYETATRAGDVLWGPRSEERRVGDERRHAW